MRPTLSINIDEAGDPGVKDGLKYLATRHEWLCLGAIAVRSSRDAEIIDWARELRLAANARQGTGLHYAKVSTGRRAAVAAALAQKPCKGFVLASHKSNLREYINPRIGAMMEAGTFYNWCFRLLLERVTSWAEAWQQSELGRLEPLEVILEERGGHDYDHLFAYIDKLRMQAETNTMFLAGKGLNPVLLDRQHWRVERKDGWAGLQLADLMASAFYQAVNSASPNFDIKPAEALAPIMAERGGDHVNVGLSLFPVSSQGPIPPEARSIFESYGFKF